LGLSAALRDRPKLTTEFDAGTPVTVQLSAGRSYATYVDEWKAGTVGPIRCDGATDGDGTVTVTRATFSFKFYSRGRQWNRLDLVTVSRDGRYTLTCRATPATAGPARFAVGDPPNDRYEPKLYRAIGALVGLPCLALVGGGVPALVVWRRRSAHKKRLQTAAWSPPSAP
jgi:hypothetical protein